MGERGGSRDRHTVVTARERAGSRRLILAYRDIKDGQPVVTSAATGSAPTCMDDSASYRPPRKS